MTLPYLAGLVEQYSAESGHPHECVLIDEPEEKVRSDAPDMGRLMKHSSIYLIGDMLNRISGRQA